MTDREKLIELIYDFVADATHEEGQRWEEACADYLLSNGVTVQEHGYVENSMCGIYQMSNMQMKWQRRFTRSCMG